MSADLLKRIDLAMGRASPDMAEVLREAKEEIDWLWRIVDEYESKQEPRDAWGVTGR